MPDWEGGGKKKKEVVFLSLAVMTIQFCEGTGLERFCFRVRALSQGQCSQLANARTLFPLDP